MIDIVERCSSITEHCCGIVITLAVRRDVTSSEHGIVDLNTTLFGVIWIDRTISILITRIQILPSSITLISRQGVQIFCGHIVIRTIGFSLKGHRRTVLLHLKHRCHNHLTILRQVASTIIIIVVVRRTRTCLTACIIEVSLTIDKTYITTSKHITIAF